MRYYFYSAVLIIAAAVLVSVLPYLLSFSGRSFAALEIPSNNSEVAGIQKYNIPPVSKNLQVPEFSARAVIIKDLATGAVLFQKNASESMPIASTTKIISALVASEYFKSNSELTVQTGASAEGSRVGLIKGENLSFRSLLYGMLLNSGNDAAFAIAENYPKGVKGFVDAMNQKAAELDLKNSHFDNPAGFDSPRHYSSAYDLSVITEEALKNDVLARIFATKETNIVSLNKKYTHQLVNLNKLLTNVWGVLGVKTGTTEEAKENLVTLVERNGKKVLIVLLGSNDRFGETTKLIEWTYSNWDWPQMF